MLDKWDMRFLVLAEHISEWSKDPSTQVGPFGSGNPEPRFVIPSAKLAYAAVVGDRHIRGFITDEGSGRLPAISFNSVDTPLGQALLKSAESPLHIAGRLKTNTWQGKTSAQLHIDDAAPVWAS